MIERGTPPFLTYLDADMAKTPTTSQTPSDESRPSRDAIRTTAQALINSRKSKIPDRIRKYLDHLRPEGLDDLVKEKVPVKLMLQDFIRPLGWKISPLLFKRYLSEVLHYNPSSPARKRAAKKAAAPAAKPRAKKAAKKTTRAKK